MDNLEQLIENKTSELMKSLEKRGLYPVDGSVGIMSREDIDEETFNDPSKQRDLLLSLEEEESIFVAGKIVLKIGDFAWNERNLDPEAFEALEEAEASMDLTEEDVNPTLYQNVEDWWDSD